MAGKTSNDKIKDGMIENLTKLLIKTDMEERQQDKKIYVRKTEIYRDLIKFVKDYL